MTPPQTHTQVIPLRVCKCDPRYMVFKHELLWSRLGCRFSVKNLFSWHFILQEIILVLGPCSMRSKTKTWESTQVFSDPPLLHAPLLTLQLLLLTLTTLKRVGLCGKTGSMFRQLTPSTQCSLCFNPWMLHNCAQLWNILGFWQRCSLFCHHTLSRPSHLVELVLSIHTAE